jgi:hypothetical protein
MGFRLNDIEAAVTNCRRGFGNRVDLALTETGSDRKQNQSLRDVITKRSGECVRPLENASERRYDQATELVNTQWARPHTEQSARALLTGQ